MRPVCGDAIHRVSTIASRVSTIASRVSTIAFTASLPIITSSIKAESLDSHPGFLFSDKRILNSN